MVIQSLLHWLFIFNQLLLRKRMLFYRISEGGVFMVVNSLVETSSIYCGWAFAIGRGDLI